MRLQTFSRRGMGTIVLSDDYTEEELRNALLLDAMEESGNGKDRVSNREKAEKVTRYGGGNRL